MKIEIVETPDLKDFEKRLNELINTGYEIKSSHAYQKKDGTQYYALLVLEERVSSPFKRLLHKDAK